MSGPAPAGRVLPIRLAVTWKGSGPAVGAQRDRLAVEHDAVRRQGQRRVDQLGDAVRDVVEAAGEHADGVAVAVHLDPHAVELGLDRRGVDPSERGLEIGAGRGQHRLDRPPDLQPDGRQAGGAEAQRDVGDGPRVAAEHQRTAHGRLGHLRRRRDRVRHHAGQRALAQPAGEQRDEEPLLVRGRARQQRAERVAAHGLRAGPARGADALEGRVDVGDRERRLGGRRGQLAQRRPADADLALAQLAGQEGDAGRELIRVQSVQGLGQARDLRGPRRRVPDRIRRLDEVAQQHARMLARPPAGCKPRHPWVRGGPVRDAMR